MRQAKTLYPSPGKAAFLGIIAVLAIFFGALFIFFIRYDTAHEREHAATVLNDELILIGEFLQDDLLKKDYQKVEIFLKGWAEKSQDIVAVKASAPNGFAIVDYVRPGQAKSPFPVTYTIRFQGRPLLSIAATKDFAPLESRLDKLNWKYLGGFLLVIMILSGLLWLAVKRLALAPLEQAELKLENAARQLERRNEALREAFLKAQESSRTKSEFLATMSHELRTPLNAIIGFSEIMTEQTFGSLGNDKYGEYAVNIHESGHHLLDLINDILDVSKIEAGSLDIHSQDLSLTEVIESSVRLIRDRAQAAKVTVEVELEEGLPLFNADSRRIIQILLNLLSNAVKFTPAGGRIVVRADCPRPENQIRISVSDTGIGIAAEDIEKAMSPFGQVDSDLSRKYEGTGLGLPLTKGLVELHDGILLLSSRLGKGTTVTVLFPPERTGAAVPVSKKKIVN